MKVDPALDDRRNRDPDAVTDVVVVCSRFSDEVRSKVQAAGLEVTSLDLASSGIVCGRMRLADLHQLERVPEVDSISADSDYFIQHR